METSYLQPILGTTKKNPVFSVHQNTKTKHYHVYYGLELFDVVPNDKEDIRFKLMCGHLRSAGMSLKALCEAFGVDPRTIRKWSNALKSGDADKLQRALAGHDTKRKLTAPVEHYVRMRLAMIYPEDPYRYSSKIRNEIKEVFDMNLSSESLRPVFNELKKDYHDWRKSLNESEDSNDDDDPDDHDGDCSTTDFSDSQRDNARDQADENTDYAQANHDSSCRPDPKNKASNNRNKDTIFLGKT